MILSNQDYLLLEEEQELVVRIAHKIEVIYLKKVNSWIY